MCYELYHSKHSMKETRKADPKPKEARETSRTPETAKPERTFEPA